MKRQTKTKTVEHRKSGKQSNSSWSQSDWSAITILHVHTAHFL